MVVDLAEHTSNINIAFIECSNGAYSCESTSELFEYRGLGVGFQSFDFACSGKVDASDLNADCEKRDGKQDHVGRYEYSGNVR